ncbi:glycosyl hydrolase 108 family protein [Novosphingobium naphthalenivorans]|uniref:glycosyl hydrolase 108 family protein n=1 Tax=Novosphingobium naphthalenivorans TaxID=273168 RepID=UPI0008332C6B|nr:glycosyl hydrolase 108 family protein [Novosphingobium naphthalenivorans]
MEPAPSDITVTAYSPRYRHASDELIDVTEGGDKVTNDPTDRGGTTKFGMSLRFLAAEGAFDDDGDGKADFDLDMDGDIDGHDVRLLTRGDAVYLYHRCFWVPLGCESHPRPIGEMLFDQGVNGGRTAAKKLLQRALNACLAEARTKMGSNSAPDLLKVDGTLGDISREAEDWVLKYPALGMPAIIREYRNAVRDRYRAIIARFPSQQKYRRGWLARAERLGRL